MNILRQLGLLGPKQHDREALQIYSGRVGSTRVANRDGVKVIDYRAADGSFDYDAYRAVQTAANKAKIGWRSIEAEEIQFLCNALAERGVNIRNVLCHGTRNGAEQKFFLEATGAEVLGTEISDTATQYPMTIQWDFHEVKPEWAGAFDVVFSNSWDHSYDPKLALSRWLTCVRQGGVMALEWSTVHGETKANPIDPFRATLPALCELLGSLVREPEFSAPEIIRLPENKRGKVFVVVSRK